MADHRKIACSTDRERPGKRSPRLWPSTDRSSASCNVSFAKGVFGGVVFLSWPAMLSNTTLRFNGLHAHFGLTSLHHC